MWEKSEIFPRAWRLNRSTISANLELIWEMSVKKLIVTTMMLALVAAGAAHGQDAEDGVVATVNGEEVRESDVAMLFSSLPAQYRQFELTAIYPQLVESLVDRKLLAQAARREGLADTAAVKHRLAYLTDEVLQNTFLTLRVEAKLTEERLRAAYETMIAARPADVEVRARHILLESEEDAKAVFAELEAGADFAELAKQKSTGPSAANGGDLGYFTQAQMVPAFAQAAFALEPGAITAAPVKTQFGWHVIKVEDRRETPPPSFEEVQTSIRDQEARQLIGEITGSLRAAADVRRFGPDGEEIAASPGENENN